MTDILFLQFKYVDSRENYFTFARVDKQIYMAGKES